MTHHIREAVIKRPRHTSTYLQSGPSDGPLIILVHGWPELAYSWRHQLPVLGALGFRAVAPDMRGYGGSSVYADPGAYALEVIVEDMLDLLNSLEADKAVWVGHDWGAPVVWSLAQHHPDRCHATAGMCVPYLPDSFCVEALLPLVDRDLYPEDTYPAAQWDYQLFHREQFDACVAHFEHDVRSTVRALFRSGKPARRPRPARTAVTRRRGGFFGGGPAPAVARDTKVLSQTDEDRYTASLQRNGFSGPNSWYLNGPANMAYSRRAPQRHLSHPCLFLHAAYDDICETMNSRLAEPMRTHCPQLTEVTVYSGHWLAQEHPRAVNAALVQWLATQLPELWSCASQPPQTPETRN